MRQFNAGSVHMLEGGEPDGWHPGRMGHLFTVHQIAQHRRIVDRREHEFDPGRSSAPRQAPTGGMEHRHHRQHDAARVKIEQRRLDAGHRMEHGRAVLIEHALGVTRGAAGIAQHARIALVALGPFGVPVLGSDPVLKLTVVKADVVFDRGPARLHPVDDRLERRIVEQHLIFGVIGDIFQLIVEQSRVDCVEHPAHPDCAVPRDQMAAVVHRQRGDPLARLDPQLTQSLGHLQCIMADLGPIGPCLAAIGPTGQNLARAMFARGVVNDPRDPKVPVLHGSQHSSLLILRSV